MKKSWKMLLSLCLILALLLSLCACGDDEAAPKVYSGTGVCGDYEYEYYTDGTACITKYSDRETVVVIPSELDGYPVTAIGDYAFWCCISLTAVTIPDSVTAIGENAFFGCRSLTAVTIPDSVTTIGDRAFAGCKSLTAVTIPKGVTTIGKEAFYHCRSLTAVTIPDSVTAIGEDAFAYCPNLTLTAHRDSYAAQYCKDNGLTYQYADAND